MNGNGFFFPLKTRFCTKNFIFSSAACCPASNTPNALGYAFFYSWISILTLGYAFFTFGSVFLTLGYGFYYICYVLTSLITLIASARCFLWGARNSIAAAVLVEKVCAAILTFVLEKFTSTWTFVKLCWILSSPESAFKISVKSSLLKKIHFPVLTNSFNSLSEGFLRTLSKPSAGK